MSGNWELMKDNDEELMVESIKMGEFWHVTTYYMFIAQVKMEQGDFKDAENFCSKMSDLHESYEYDGANVWQYYSLGNLKIFSRNLFDAIKVCDAGVQISEKFGMDPFIVHLLGVKANAQICLRDLDGASISLHKAEEIFNQQQIVPPMYAVSYHVALFSLYVNLLEKAKKSNDYSKTREYLKKSDKMGKKMLRTANRYGYWRLEAFRVLSLYHWIINRQAKAIKWWVKSIKEAERMRGKPFLARIYKDIGTRIIEEKSKYNEVNGITAAQYREKAREMFEEMDLQWDIDELDRIVSYR